MLNSSKEDGKEGRYLWKYWLVAFALREYSSCAEQSIPNNLGTQTRKAAPKGSNHVYMLQTSDPDFTHWNRPLAQNTILTKLEIGGENFRIFRFMASSERCTHLLANEVEDCFKPHQ